MPFALGSSTHSNTFKTRCSASMYQDWCVAASSGATVPEVHLAWCCRDMREMELVGESLPSMLATTGDVKETHFTLSLYCSGKVDCLGYLLGRPLHCHEVRWVHISHLPSLKIGLVERSHRGCVVCDAEKGPQPLLCAQCAYRAIRL